MIDDHKTRQNQYSVAKRVEQKQNFALSYLFWPHFKWQYHGKLALDMRNFQFWGGAREIENGAS